MKNAPLATSIALCGLTFASCSTVPHAPPQKPGCVSGQKFKDQWASAKITRNHPIVDVHTHAFNARYLPLKRIVDGRKWGLGLWWLPEAILDDVAVLAATNTPKTEYQAKCQDREIQEWANAHGKQIHDDSERLVAIFKNPVENPKFSIWRHPDEDEPTALSPLGWMFHKLVGAPLARYVVNQMFDHDAGQNPLTQKETTASFAVTLMSSEERIRERMEDSFGDVDLFVYQNMDTVPSFYRHRDSAFVVDDGNTQLTGAYHYSHDDVKDRNGVGISALPRIRKICKDSHGRMIYFVAWNPFRTIALQRQSKSEKNKLVPSLDIVKNAIRNGATGVKFYPPLGYQPFYNLKSDHNFKPDQLPKKPFILLHGAAREQWESRYGKMPSGEGVREKLNEINEELFAWCEKHDIPIFTHCSTGEFRAYYTKEYAENANPEYWIPILKKYPNLRLCFGHAGGESDWYGGCVTPGGDVDHPKDWGPTVRELCRTYKNVYCEFGCHDHLQDSDGIPTHAEPLYHTLLRELPRTGEGRWLLADKVMYGSDFYMPINTSPQGYLEGFERLFSLPGMQPYKAKFFSENAMKYLKRNVTDKYRAGR